MDYYALGHADALAVFYKDAGFFGDRFRANWGVMKGDLRRMAAIGQVGLAAAGAHGGLQAIQNTQPGASKTQIALNAVGGGIGGIGGVATGLATGGLKGVKPGYDKGIHVGEQLAAPAFRDTLMQQMRGESPQAQKPAPQSKTVSQYTTTGVSQPSLADIRAARL